MITDQAFVLHKRAFKDSSQLIKLITLNHGIIDVIAKGSLRPKSKLNGQLQPFTLTQVNLVGRSSLKTLIDADQSTTLKQGDYKKHVSMLYCNELLTLIKVDELSSELIFKAYQQTVEKLQNNPSIRQVLRWFEWQLCCQLGYELQLPEKFTARDFIEFDPINGLIINNSNYNLKVKSRTCMAVTFKEFINASTLNPQQLNEISNLMRVVINHLVNGKTIKCRELLKINNY